MKAQEKKRLIKSYQNLPQDARTQFDTQYSEGYTEFAQKITKPDGTSIYVVPLETEDAVYMVKVDVVVDSKFSEEEFDREILGSGKDDDELGDAPEQDKDAEQGDGQFVLVHGDYSEIENSQAAKEDPEI